MPDTPSARRGPKPAQVRLDRFAILHVAREHRLSASESWLLLVLTLLAEWRSQTWLGTIGELADDARVSRKVASAGLGSLEAAGLIAILSPFGPNRTGEVEVVCYPELVHLSTFAPDVNRASVALDSRPNRVNWHSDTDDDQHLRAETLRNKDAPKEQGTDESRATGWDEDEPFCTDSLCVTCRAPANPASAANGRDYCIDCEPF